MKRLIPILFSAVMAAGCASNDTGAPPPPVKPMTQAEIDAMPPQARAAMEAAQAQGQETARTRGQVGGGK